VGRASHPGEPAQGETGCNSVSAHRPDLAYLYFIADLLLNELEGRGYFNNTLQFLAENLCPLVGTFLDTPESLEAVCWGNCRRLTGTRNRDVARVTFRFASME
jgi:hypothetical protein